ncbi:Ala-tRNA(Pro) hydrolase [Skermanella stibiiresistens SB22]|uniref:Alanine--tRNA ligase n=1 Tax=Skermanella stibiiresistens SB22 TaxID=1385369 RepID=W9HEC3_9PROT|nr:alanyl-tRNA editing protein [Skermanella stibiiresistens]EWY42233.1 Ala-tRNA(Pro) hydrolase [Skermanella stibiiresistens SB22]
MESIFRQDAYATRCAATVMGVDERGVTLDRTVCYPTGGGQPGDTGTLHHGGTATRIVDTIKGDGLDTAIHVLEPGSAAPAVGDSVEVEIDWDRRFAHMRMHTCLHLLCAVVPGSVTGGQIGADKSRLDFNVPSASLDKDALTEALNRLIEADHVVGQRWIDDAELEANPDLVRTMSVRPPTGTGKVRLVEIDGVDLQPCGGTHVARTGEIGRVEVTKIENKGKQNRRVVVALTA